MRPEGVAFSAWDPALGKIEVNGQGRYDGYAIHDAVCTYDTYEDVNCTEHGQCKYALPYAPVIYTSIHQRLRFMREELNTQRYSVP